MCFVFKSAVVFLCKERLRQKKKSLIVRSWIILKTLNDNPSFCQGGSSKSSAAEVEIIRYQVKCEIKTNKTKYLNLRLYDIKCNALIIHTLKDLKTQEYCKTGYCQTDTHTLVLLELLSEPKSPNSVCAKNNNFCLQVLIPVTEVQVRASNPKDVDSHYLWELIHLKSQIQRRNEKVYHLSNRYSEEKD